MKIEKNKIVFASVLAVVIIFIVAYSVLIFSEDGEETENLPHTLLPELEEEDEEYNSKLDAINALQDVRETTVPSIYDEKLLDSMGYYDPDLKERRKEEIVDSIYKVGMIDYSENSYRNNHSGKIQEEVSKPQEILKADNLESSISAKEIALEHQLFYSSAPLENNANIEIQNQTEQIIVEVDGEQIVKSGSRLKMRMTKSAFINEKWIPENTPLFGFINFGVNRALINIENIDHHHVKLAAYDLQDGSEGIYVENSFRAEAGREVIDDIIQDIDIPGIPQVGGIKKVFQRNNRNIKVTITNNYKLILKARVQ